MAAQAGQISIPRIDAMPDLPTPYLMRDWKNVAIKYDSFIYDKNKTGQYLPLVSYTTNGINYPGQKQIKLHTYVGTNSTQNSEGINVLPSLVGAALVGQNIRSVYGLDRLLMAQDFYNKANGENIYLNNSSAGSGGDWWYDVMPNVYFYQLYDKFPDFNPEANFQFRSIADKFLEATQKMGGKATPWTKANMNYRAWNFKTMEGNANGVKEPESAGTFAWLLYHAYKKTKNQDYRKAAEWSMEFLNTLNANPSYELQLPYGAYMAAKMNAEIGTNYNTEKVVNWCFNRGPLRGWGTIVGKWGSMDVSGLVGEANDGGNDYAFLMNGMQQSAALVPMVRYDKRFSKAIGKWMLNLSNASRLFYPGFLPPAQQDGSLWSQTNDPKAIIAHEAMKQKFQNLSPYATGDALGGGWASTNLAIYGSSSVGYLGAIVRTTNIDKILQLNLNATDFYSDASYPSYLYYNPFDTQKAVLLDVGNDQHDIYEALSEKMISFGKTGLVSIIIPAKEAVLIVVTPAGGKISYIKNKMLVDNVVVDFNQKKVPFTFSPRIKALEAQSYLIEKGKTTSVFCTVEDLDSDSLTFNWSSTLGEIIGQKNEVIWNASQTIGNVDIKVVVKDSEGNTDSLTIKIEVVDVINKAPIIDRLLAASRYTGPTGTISILCDAMDENGDSLTYVWSSDQGSISGTGNNVQWTAPNAEGIYTIKVTVDDGKGLSTKAQVSLLVKEFNDGGQLIAWYPFEGNAKDKSGNDHNGTAKGAILTADFFGKPLSSYYFNGGSQNIEVLNTSKLNFQDGITLSLWCKPNLGSDKEKFLVSHGSWQNRWKLSITPTGNLRWTINTLTKIVDTDSDIIVTNDSIYHVVATYDGETALIYVNGHLNAFKPLTGKIRTTTLPLLMGQMIPSDAAYNYKGILDEIKIYDYAINPVNVNLLYQQSIVSKTQNSNISRTRTITIYPNPVQHTLYIDMTNSQIDASSISISDVTGHQVYSMDIKNITIHQLDVSKLAAGVYFMRISNQLGAIIQSIQFIKS
ncbi:MAG: T9SS type A sorting domain-containing protein [Saprospiraceae bacterium]|nr:T9SS type A sorting domain-containing protein [Saprospiraceae bacterium]